jgi:hypothetical protein
MHEITVWIGDAIGETHELILLIELVVKGEAAHDGLFLVLVRVPKSFRFELQRATVLFPYFFWGSIAVRFHPLLIEQPFLLKVDQVKGDLLFMREISDLIIKPGSVALGIAVHSHQQIILGRGHQDGKVQISALKIRIEAEIFFL